MLIRRIAFVFAHLAALALVAMPLPILAEGIAVPSLPALPIPSKNPATARSGVYRLDPTHSSLVFTVRHLGLSDYTLRFRTLDARLGWNAADPARSTLTVTVDPASVWTGFPFPETTDFDAEIRNRFLAVAEHPAIGFTATAIERTGLDTGRVTGDLAFFGATHPVTLDVTFNGAYETVPVENVTKLGFTARTRFERSLWGMTALAGAVGDTVDVVIQAEFQPAAE